MIDILIVLAGLLIVSAGAVVFILTLFSINKNEEENLEDVSHCPTVYKCYACNWKGASPKVNEKTDAVNQWLSCPVCGNLV